MRYLDVFKMPKATTIMARTSSITNSFVNGIIPCIHPSDEEVRNTLDILGMKIDDVRCAYCGDKCTEWDHFRPLVKDKKPTGYITEINNLVPACGKCNQSKGNRNWKEWILSDAQHSPKTRRIPNIDLLIKRLENFERQSTPIVIDFETVVGKELWEEHWDNCNKLHEQMRECQKLSDYIRKLIKTSLEKSNSEGLEKDETNIVLTEKVNLMKKSFLSEIKSLIKPTQRTVSYDTISSNTQKNPIIQNNSIHTGDLKNEKVGIIVQQDFKNLLESNLIPRYIIEKLQGLNYCKNIFDINFPVLLKVKIGIDPSLQRKDHLGRDRYYAKTITIYNEQYYLTSQWYDKNKNKLIDFIEKYRIN